MTLLLWAFFLLRLFTRVTRAAFSRSATALARVEARVAGGDRETHRLL